MNEVKYPPETVHWVARNADGSVLHVGTTEPEQVTTTGQPTFEQAASGNEQLSKLAPFSAKFPPMPPTGKPVQFGEIYSLDSVLYQVRQSHTRTEHDPQTVPALFLWYRADASIDWVAGEQVYVGTIRTDAGIAYKCIQSHVTQADWKPANVPALWEVSLPPDIPNEFPEWVQPQGAHDAYAVGAKVSHNGKHWINTYPANVYAPGVYGWTEQ